LKGRDEREMGTANKGGGRWWGGEGGRERAGEQGGGKGAGGEFLRGGAGE